MFCLFKYSIKDRKQHETQAQRWLCIGACLSGEYTTLLTILSICVRLGSYWGHTCQRQIVAWSPQMWRDNVQIESRGRWGGYKGVTTLVVVSLSTSTRPFVLKSKTIWALILSLDVQDETTWGKNNGVDAVHLYASSMHRCCPALADIHTASTRYKQIRPQAETSEQNASHMLTRILMLYSVPPSCHQLLLGNAWGPGNRRKRRREETKQPD